LDQLAPAFHEPLLLAGELLQLGGTLRRVGDLRRLEGALAEVVLRVGEGLEVVRGVLQLLREVRRGLGRLLRERLDELVQPSRGGTEVLEGVFALVVANGVAGFAQILRKRLAGDLDAGAQRPASAVAFFAPAVKSSASPSRIVAFALSADFSGVPSG